MCDAAWTAMSALTRFFGIMYVTEPLIQLFEMVLFRNVMNCIFQNDDYIFKSFLGR